MEIFNQKDSKIIPPASATNSSEFLLFVHNGKSDKSNKAKKDYRNDIRRPNEPTKGISQGQINPKKTHNPRNS